MKVEMSAEVIKETVSQEGDKPRTKLKVVHLCDRCGFEMLERNCKVLCPNCGNRFDCSDLNIYFD
jgi:rubrerythrin